MGGRVAEMIIYGDLSTGASDDLQRNTELARKMVREWGMSERVGPMAWGSQGMVFLGEDLMHTRDYSEDTSRVVDEEVARILREQEVRATSVLREHKTGLEAVAHALLEFETVPGDEIARLVDAAYGRPVHTVAEGEEKLATERYAPSLSGGVIASPVSSLPSAGLPPTEV
jgi:cell division protease FtsH